MACSDIYGRSGFAASAVGRRKPSAGSIAAPALGPKQPLDSGGQAPVNAAVPKSGQLWDATFLERSALLGDLRALAEPLLSGATWPSLEACSAFVEAERRARAAELPAVRFAPPSTRSRSQPVDIRQLYDGRIALHGEVPCLGTSYHDLLNVLVWAAFPRAKRALHARQYRALEAWLPADAARLPNRRTREQDALALFDEGGSLLVVPPALAAALRAALASDRAAGEKLALDSAARILLFGHAVMEHVCFESTALSSAALVVCLDPPLPEGRALFDRVDQTLAERLSDPREFASPVFDAVLAIQPPAQAWLRAEGPKG
jgi:hypothetical protein